MENIERFLSNIKMEAGRRLSNPFVYSYYIALIFLNWEIVFLSLSSDLGTVEKISLILTKINIWKILWYPIIIASLYSFLIPFLALASNSVIAFVKMLANNVYRYFDKDSYLSIDKSLIIKKELNNIKIRNSELFKETNELREEHEKKIKEYLKQIELLEINNIKMESELIDIKKENLALSEKIEVGKLEKDHKEQFSRLQDHEKKILKILSENDSLSEDVLIAHLRLNNQKFKYHLDNLTQKNYVAFPRTGMVELSSVGRSVYFNRLPE